MQNNQNTIKKESFQIRPDHIHDFFPLYPVSSTRQKDSDRRTDHSSSLESLNMELFKRQMESVGENCDDMPELEEDDNAACSEDSDGTSVIIGNDNLIATKTKTSIITENTTLTLSSTRQVESIGENFDEDTTSTPPIIMRYTADEYLSGSWPGGPSEQKQFENLDPVENLAVSIENMSLEDRVQIYERSVSLTLNEFNQQLQALRYNNAKADEVNELIKQVQLNEYTDLNGHKFYFVYDSRSKQFEDLRMYEVG